MFKLPTQCLFSFISLFVNKAKKLLLHLKRQTRISVGLCYTVMKLKNTVLSLDLAADPYFETNQS